MSRAPSQASRVASAESEPPAGELTETQASHKEAWTHLAAQDDVRQVSRASLPTESAEVEPLEHPPAQDPIWFGVAAFVIGWCSLVLVVVAIATPCWWSSWSQGTVLCPISDKGSTCNLYISVGIWEVCSYYGDVEESFDVSCKRWSSCDGDCKKCQSGVYNALIWGMSGILGLLAALGLTAALKVCKLKVVATFILGWTDWQGAVGCYFYCLCGKPVPRRSNRMYGHRIQCVRFNV